MFDIKARNRGGCTLQQSAYHYSNFSCWPHISLFRTPSRSLCNFTVSLLCLLLCDSLPVCCEIIWGVSQSLAPVQGDTCWFLHTLGTLEPGSTSYSPSHQLHKAWEEQGNNLCWKAQHCTTVVGGCQWYLQRENGAVHRVELSLCWLPLPFLHHSLGISVSGWMVKVLIAYLRAIEEQLEGGVGFPCSWMCRQV